MKFAALFLALFAVAACQPTTTTPTADAAPAVSSGATQMPAGLSADEQLIWNTLTPSAQAQAADHVANGGSFADFIAG